MGQLARVRQAQTRDHDDRGGRHARALVDMSARGQRLQALAQAAQGLASPVAQPKLGAPERLKLADVAEICKRIAGDTLYELMLDRYDTAAEVRQAFLSLKDAYPNAWAVANNSTGLELGREVANPGRKELSKYRAALAANLPAATVAAPTTAPTWGATTAPAKPAPTLMLGASPSVGASGNAVAWSTVKDSYLSRPKKPPSVKNVAKGEVEQTSDETREIAITANTASGRLEVVLHFHPAKKGNYLHFKAARDAAENYQVNWGHWLVQSAGVTEGSFA